MKTEKKTIFNLNLELDRLAGQNPLPNASYYLFNCSAMRNDKFKYGVYNHFVSWANDSYTQEIREPSLVNAERVIRKFREINQPLLRINDLPDLVVYIFNLGGHAIIEKTTGDEYLTRYLRPTTYVYTDYRGFINTESIPTEMFHRAPSARLRMKILNRDHRRCKICGASPRENVHVELHLHHIRPFHRGGLTAEENLITLCHTCHKGIDPNTIDYSLYSCINVKTDFIAVND